METNIEKSTMSELDLEYVVVKIGTEQYGINIQYVDNITRLSKITRVPKVQHYMQGVMNLRGEVVAVMSLRKKMGLSADEFTNDTRIIILKLNSQDEVGVIVDEVKEVVNLTEDEIEKVFYDVKDEKSSYVSGIGKHNGELISLLDIAAVISNKEREATS